MPTFRPHAPILRNRLGRNWLNYLRMIFGTPSQRRLARGGLRVNVIRYWETEYAKLTDEQMRHQGLLLRGRARSGESLDRLLPEVFGLGCVSSCAICICVPSTCSSRPESFCIKGGLRRWPPAKAKR